MKIIFVDTETYYDKDYSLSKMQTDEYILDPRFETMGVSVKVGDEMTQWFSGGELETAGWLHANFDWANSAVCCHNTLFDGFILTQLYGIQPKLWMDTKSMAVMLYPYLKSFSLANLAKQFGLRDKGTYVANMLGRSRASLDENEMTLYSAYCILDTEITKELCDLLLPRIPALELRLIDMTIRMFTEPQFVGDSKKMAELYAAELKRKEDVLAQSGVDKADLMSNPKLAALLQAQGIAPPTKMSARTGKEAFAFAKSDKAFTDLLDHEDPVVQAIVAARLGVKSTIAETRALTMFNTSNRPAKLGLETTLDHRTVTAIRVLEESPGGALPVYLNFWGAKTTGRYSGGNKINWQNLPVRGPSAGLRDTICAPAGHTLVVGDSSNIELRVAMVLAGQTDVVDKIRAGEDLYCDFASKMFGRTITKADKKERLLGKIAMLSLQYGAGWRKFKEMVRQQSGEIIADTSAENTVNLYRSVHHKVVDMWDRLNNVVLPEIAAGCPNLLAIDSNAWLICTGEGFGVHANPGVVYHNLRKVSRVDDYGRPQQDWVYDMGRETPKLYGGKVFENACVDGDALVLTELGWMPLHSITTERVHDGEKFVQHGGKVYKGVQECVVVDGVRMTPDHEVLTNEGWKPALDKPKPFRPDLRSADGGTTRPFRWAQDVLAVSVHLREARSARGVRGYEGNEARRNAELRVHDEAAHRGGQPQARHVRAPGILGVSKHGRSLPAALALRMEKLRRAGYHGLRSVARGVRELLGRYGEQLQAGAGLGPRRQYAGVLAGELSMGYAESERTEQAQPHRRGPSSAVESYGYTKVDAVLPARAGATTREVYDLMDCGELHRFVVMGATGPFIVHNCQHVARQIVMWQTARINERYPVALSVHDEAVCVVKNEHLHDALQYMEECLSLAPPWCRGDIPLACEVGFGGTYGSAK